MNIIEFDICGQICPSTLLIALKEINKYHAQLKDGTVRLAFKTDNRDAVTTIPESAENMGYGVEVSQGKGCYLIEVRGR